MARDDSERNWYVLKIFHVISNEDFQWFILDHTYNMRNIFLQYVMYNREYTRTK